MLLIYFRRDAIILTERNRRCREHEDFADMQLCRKIQGQFYRVSRILQKNSLGDGDFMLYAFPERMTERRNQWYFDLKKEVPAAIYKSSVKEKIRAFRKIIKETGLDTVHTHFTDMKTDMCVNIACLGLRVKNSSTTEAASAASAQ